MKIIKVNDKNSKQAERLKRIYENAGMVLIKTEQTGFGKFSLYYDDVHGEVFGIRIRIGKKVFYAKRDYYGGIEVRSAKDKELREATWYFQNDGTEMFNSPLREAVVYLESAGAIE